MPNQIGHPLVVFLHESNLQYITVKAASAKKVTTATGGSSTWETRKKQMNKQNRKGNNKVVEVDKMQYVYAFLVGGVLCVAAQVLIDKTGLTPARILVIYVTAGVVLTAAGLYEPLVDFAGAGATVPLTGFGYSLAKGVEESIARDGYIGILSGGLSACSAGIAAAIFFAGVMTVFRRPRAKG